MTSIVGRIADRMVGRLVPKAVASAETSWYEPCGPCGWIDLWGGFYGRQARLCHIAGGQTGCTSCSYIDGC